MKFKGGAVLAILGVFVMTYVMFAAINYISYSVVDRVEKDGFVNIPTGSNLSEQSIILQEQEFISDSLDYQTYATMMKIDSVYPGRYKLSKGMSYKEMMSVLNTGRQTPVKVTFTSTYSFGNIASKVSRFIEADSTSLVEAFRSDSVQNLFGMDSLTMSMMFVPNTYEFYWNTSAVQFFERMHKEYKRFWSQKNREQRLDSLGMTKLQAMTLASIVYGETKYSPEMPTVAGVYMNRLKKRMLLQADPTVVYAHGDFGIRRVLKKHLLIDSPYNTYKYLGLPPSPINFPSITAIDAVLNYKQTNYLFFCASEMLDGTHRFASTYSQHLQNARKYAKRLNQEGIK